MADERPEANGAAESGQNKKKGSDLKTRVISACFMLPLLVFLWLGGFWLLTVIILLSVRCMHEFYNGWEKLGIRPDRRVGYISYGLWVLLGVLPFLLDSKWRAAADRFARPDRIPAVYLWLFITMALALCVCIFDKKNDHSIASGPVGALGSLYIGFLMSHIALVRYLPRGEVLVWLTFVISIFTDSFAYFGGRLFGKKTGKMAPAISPNKTMAGFYAGCIGGPLACFLFALIAAPEMKLQFALIGFIGSFFSQGGDLVESAFKRKMGIKDFSNLIPGHGGVLDRLDSAMFTSSFVFYYSVFILGVLNNTVVTSA
ncbi:MAG: phosphatidate cytidylyltransferase [Firmicutes bacterium]|nr:phosphatidate cytidylyltransferase [Bacillota bacterium]